MKKLHFLFSIFALAGLMLITSCEDDEDDPTKEPPKLTVKPSADTANQHPGDTVKYELSIASDLSIESFKIAASTPGADGTSAGSYTFDKNDHAIDTAYTYVIPTTFLKGTITLTFTVANKDSAVSVEKYIKVTEKVVEPEDKDVIEYSAKMILLTASATSKSFFVVDSGDAYSFTEIDASADLKKQVDFAYYYGATDSATLASLKDVPTAWAEKAGDISGWTQNDTKLKKLTDVTFADIKKDSELEAAFDVTDGTTKISKLMKDDVVAFETAGGVKGIFSVVEVKGTWIEGDYIKLDVKVMN